MKKENDILKWFNGEISTEELKTLYPSEDFSILEKIRFYSKHLEVPKIDAQKSLEDFKRRSLKKKLTKVIPLNNKTFMRIAAALVVLFGITYVYFNNQTELYKTEVAQTVTLKLPDESEVTLNAQSTLALDKKEWKKNRTLDLKGEAYFKVTKGEVFTVITDVGAIRVLGTQFNVKDRKDFFEVQCYEGSVRVAYNQGETILTTGKTFRIVNGEKVIVKDFQSVNPSWVVQESSFDNVPLWQVINELEIQYNISITANDVDTSKLYSGSFTHTNKQLALQSVTIPLKLSYKLKDNQVEFYNYESE